MGLFDFLKGNKDKSDKESNGVSINSPLSGKVIKLTDIKDEVFSQKMMGDGFAIAPTDGKIVSPVDGEIVSLFPTGHAVGLKTKEGVEVLIHFGLDTVNLKGEGFSIKASEGDKVNVGDTLIEVNISEVESKVPSIDTPVIFTNLADYKLNINEDLYGKEVNSTDKLFDLKK